MEKHLNVGRLADRLFVAGGYGSGKTEVAVNLARELRRQGEDLVYLVDLDVVNPYFRSREAVGTLAREGVVVVAPQGDDFYSDQPIILSEVRGLLTVPPGKVVLDAGGDEAGGAVLASLRDCLPAGSYELWVVLNARRPFTDTAEGSLRMVRQIQNASGLTATGLVSNTHLLSETTKELVLAGAQIAREVSKELSIPLVFVSASERIAGSMSEEECGSPLLPLRLTMLRPWEKKTHA